MATQTPNYNLDLYETGDAAALTDQYNSAMRKIDNDLKTFNQGITVASNAANANTAKLNALGATDTNTATALKTKIDTTATTATTANATATTANATANANTAKLNALGADTTTNATALKTKIDATATKIDATTTNLNQNYYTKTQSDSKYVIKPTQQTNLVAIGDSYFEGFRTNNPATDSMIVKASNMLGLTCKNYSVGGSGFITKTTFSQQLDNARNNVDPETVKYVVIGGGRNDDYNSLSENTVRDTLNKAKTLFPNSQIVFIPLMWDNTYPTYNDEQKYATMISGAQAANTWTVRDAPTWGLYYATGMTDIHPNTEGSTKYAQYIATAIQNNMTTMPRQELHKDVTLTGITDGTFKVFIDGLNIHLIFRGNKTEWNQNVFATINTPNNWGVYQIITGFTDNNTMLRLKFNGHEISAIDTYPSTGAGGPGYINFKYSFNAFQHL